MIDKKRDIYVRLEKVSQIIEKLEEIKEKEKVLKTLFNECDKLVIRENKLFESWHGHLETTSQKLEHISL